MVQLAVYKGCCHKAAIEKYYLAHHSLSREKDEKRKAHAGAND
jgi:hypothetical protein